jgi:perosamine synthetase
MAQVLNYGQHWIEEDDIEAVAEALRSDFITQGPRVGEFEKALAHYVGSKYAVAVSNGTAALHLAVAALKREPGMDGDIEGITAPNTFVASANCLCYNGIKPNFADIDAMNYSIDPIEIKKRLTSETRILIPVHFAGQVCDMEAISQLKQNPGTGNGPLYIIEDASHAVGSRYENGKRVGSCFYSDMTTFSFHPVKTIATGEGGAITTNNKELYERLLLLRNHGITKDPGLLINNDPGFVGPWYYEMHDLGFNYRLTDMQAALGTSQLKKIDAFVQRRREIIATYNEAFKEISWLTIPYEKPGLFSAFHLYVLKFDFESMGKTRTQVMAELREKGVGTQVLYIPVHLQPYYQEHYGFKPGDFPKAESYYQQCLSIPLFPKMTDEDVKQVIEAIK